MEVGRGALDCGLATPRSTIRSGRARKRRERVAMRVRRCLNPPCSMVRANQMRILLAIIALASCALSLPCVADGADQPNGAPPPPTKTKTAQAPQPTWDEFAPLYGAKAHAAVVGDFVKKYHLRETKSPHGETASGEVGSYAPKGDAYYVMYSKGEIDSIYLRVGPWPDTKEYRGEVTYSQALPCGLLKSDKQEAVIKKIGQITSKDTGEAYEVWSVSQGLDLLVFFDKKEGFITGMSVSKAEKGE